MSDAQLFEKFLENLEVENKEQISERYGEITCSLNKKFRETESKKANSLQVGSYGRNTAINGISDLDMIYIMPKSDWERFKDGRQSALLQEVRNAVLARYPATDIKGDGQVVVVSFENQEIEIVPGFEQEDGSFKYPDTHDGGSWSITNPRAEIDELAVADEKKNKNLKRLCRMVRAWKNKHGMEIGGLLIDTLAYNFLETTKEYDEKSYLYYPEMMRDFFAYISTLEKQEYYLAPGSNQRVYCKKYFQNKAKRTLELVEDAIEAVGQKNECEKWRKVFGRAFPVSSQMEKAIANESVRVQPYKNTEEFIEDMFPIDIKHSLSIDCDVKQDGFREHGLIEMIKRKLPLLPKKKLHFYVSANDVPLPFELYWKVLNRGEVAERRNDIRGQIVKDKGCAQKDENTKFRGDHIVECYAVKRGVVVAKDRIHVPIATGE